MFGGSSVASAERMKEVAGLILSYPKERLVVVLSAMGKTTNNLLLAGEKAVCCGVSNVSELREFLCVQELHLKRVDELGLDRSVISGKDGSADLQSFIQQFPEASFARRSEEPSDKGFFK